MSLRSLISILCCVAATCIATPGLSAPTPPVDATAELRAAIDALKANHINRDKVDWAKLEAAAFAKAQDAKTAADTYAAIWMLINSLGEKHTFLQTADAVAAQEKNKQVGSTPPTPFNPPEAWHLDGGAALLRVPGFMGNEAEDRATVGALRQALNRFAARGICRYVVDLRANWGGNMHPMQSGLAALLGTPPYGYMIVSGKEYPFGGDASPMRWDNGPALAPYADAVAKIAHPHIAVLIDGGTASSGEFTAIAFKGLPYVRFFGSPSAGMVTNNSAFSLPDGARLFISTGLSADRQHRTYPGALTPDVQSVPGQPTVDAAMTWLKSQPCR